MAYSIKDAETDRIIPDLARAKGMAIVDAIREARENELRRERAKVSLRQGVFRRFVGRRPMTIDASAVVAILDAEADAPEPPRAGRPG